MVVVSGVLKVLLCDGSVKLFCRLPEYYCFDTLCMRDKALSDTVVVNGEGET